MSGIDKPGGLRDICKLEACATIWGGSVKMLTHEFGN